MENGKLKAFDVLVIEHPTKKAEKDGGTSAILVEPYTVLARDSEHAKLLVARSIPGGTAIDRCEVLVRPFS